MKNFNTLLICYEMKKVENSRIRGLDLNPGNQASRLAFSKHLTLNYSMYKTG